MNEFSSIYILRNFTNDDHLNMQLRKSLMRTIKHKHKNFKTRLLKLVTLFQCRGKLVAPRATHFRINDESKRKFPLEEMSSICSIIFTSFLVAEIRRKHTVAVDTVSRPRNAVSETIRFRSLYTPGFQGIKSRQLTNKVSHEIF